MSRLLSGLLGGALAGGAAHAASLPDDRADVMYHSYDGGGLTAQGPALLVRKKLADRVSLSGTYYVDMVSNASIDVVTTASKYKETRREVDLSLDYVTRDSTITLATSSSKEPDYIANSNSIDIAQEVFGGMSTISLGFTRGNDKVGKKGEGFFDHATHWAYRVGLTQILSPTWLMSANYEAIADDGFLASPYRVVREFGTFDKHEEDPRTRSSRAIKLRLNGDIGSGQAVHADYRYFRDNWAIRAHTLELGYSRYFGEKWLGDAYGRYYTQQHALFYFDDAPANETYISRNRQLSTFKTETVGTKVSYIAKRIEGQYEIKLNGALEVVRYRFSDFTDSRTGKPYAFDARVLQLFVSANF